MTQSANRVVFDLSFVEDAYNELPDHLRNKENLVKLLIVIASRMERVQTEAINLCYSRLLDNAEGEMLDIIANNIFISRESQSDSSLKGALQLRALRQDAEGTRDEVVKLLKVLSGGSDVKVFKSVKKYVEVVFSSECITTEDLKVSLSDIFPIGTNVVIGDLGQGLKTFATDSEHGGGSEKIGTLESIHDNPSEKTQGTAVIIYADERDL